MFQHRYITLVAIMYVSLWNLVGTIFGIINVIVTLLLTAPLPLS